MRKLDLDEMTSYYFLNESGIVKFDNEKSIRNLVQMWADLVSSPLYENKEIVQLFYKFITGGIDRERGQLSERARLLWNQVVKSGRVTLEELENESWMLFRENELSESLRTILKLQLSKKLKDSKTSEDQLISLVNRILNLKKKQSSDVQDIWVSDWTRFLSNYSRGRTILSLSGMQETVPKRDDVEELEVINSSLPTSKAEEEIKSAPINSLLESSTPKGRRGASWISKCVRFLSFTSLP